MTSPPLLELAGIVKRFGAVVAVDGAGLSLAAGEIHALVGENGAGKSTLVKILSGALRRDEGSIRLDGVETEFGCPADAMHAGIGMIPQESQLVPGMTIAENIVLGSEPARRRTPFVDRRAMERIAAAATSQLGEAIDLGVPVERLRMAERQLVAIARAIARKVRVLALDEPTAALSPREVDALFRLLRRLKSEGAGILFISHRLDEVFKIADRVTIMRDGKAVATRPAASLDRKTMIRLMVGHEQADGTLRQPASFGEELLRLERVRSGRLRGIDLTLRRGEVLGLGGLVGAGRTELARLIFGADRREAGRIVLLGRDVAPRSPREAIALGIGLLTEDRDRLGLVRHMNVRENITLAGLGRLCRGPFVSPTRERAAALGHVETLRIKARSIDAPIGQLSGGNRQKVVLARWLEMESLVYLFDEPTAGVDVGARDEIHGLIARLAARGCGVIVISSDLEELLAVADRVVVLCDGRIAGELAHAEATRERIMALATAFTAREATA